MYMYDTNCQPFIGDTIQDYCFDWLLILWTSDIHMYMYDTNCQPFIGDTIQDYCFDWLLILWTSDRLIQTVNLLLVIPYKMDKLTCVDSSH